MCLLVAVPLRSPSCSQTPVFANRISACAWELTQEWPGRLSQTLATLIPGRRRNLIGMFLLPEKLPRSIMTPSERDRARSANCVTTQIVTKGESHFNY